MGFLHLNLSTLLNYHLNTPNHLSCPAAFPVVSLHLYLFLYISLSRFYEMHFVLQV